MEKNKKLNTVKQSILNQIKKKENFERAVKGISYVSAYSLTRGRIKLSEEEIRQLLVDNPQMVDMVKNINEGKCK